MSFFRDIRSQLADKKYAEISPQHAQALLDALALTMVAEGDVSSREQGQAERIRQALAERTTIDTKAYLSQAIEAAAPIAGDPQAIDAQAKAIAERLDDPILREEAYYLSMRIAAVDINVVSDETQVLSSFVQAFDIPRERLGRLTKKLRELT